MDQDLHNLKDDMIAFIEGHGLRRFNAYLEDEVPSVPWSTDEDHPDAWKDFVELAKASEVHFVTMNHDSLDKEDVQLLEAAADDYDGLLIDDSDPEEE